MREGPNLEDAEQTLIEDINVARNALESLKSDTGHTSRQHSKVPTDTDEKHQHITTSEDIKPHTEGQCHNGKHPDEEIAREPIPMHSE